MKKKDLGTHVLSTTLTVNTKYNQKELNYYLSGNGAPNIAVNLTSLTGKSRKGTYNANYKHYSQIMHWNENRWKSCFLITPPPTQRMLDTLHGNAAHQVKVPLKYFTFHKHSGLQKLWEENVPSTD